MHFGVNTCVLFSLILICRLSFLFISILINTGAESEVEVKSFNFQSTCHLALDMCNNNYNCRLALQPVLQYCELSRCTRDACMAALQNFYRSTELKWSLEVAFCLCK